MWPKLGKLLLYGEMIGYNVGYVREKKEGKNKRKTTKTTTNPSIIATAIQHTPKYPKTITLKSTNQTQNDKNPTNTRKRKEQLIMWR